MQSPETYTMNAFFNNHFPQTLPVYDQLNAELRIEVDIC
jgi:hypothetical protein